ncbi:tetratricopeptide repeat protein [Saccharibacillus sacchari]|uniref:tetratricopeptide repeat protein n=1 Tax=Saccharibacillus sacchari TaxID=456493 RepID=UPI0004AFEBA0|nr:tetratricopeptide repeat protein [Saccharibacillus sacchari]
MIRDGRYYYGLGLESYESGNFEEALRCLLKSAELQKHFKTFELLYESYSAVGDEYEAKKCIAQAFALSSGNSKVATKFSKMLLRENQREQAKEVLQSVIFKNPTYGPARELLRFLDSEGNS